MDFIRSHKLIAATIAIQIVALPLILLMVRQQQEIRTQAQASTALYFTPTSSLGTPIETTAGQSLSLDLMMNPGTNLVSFAKIEINYDSSLLEPDSVNPVVVNTTAFPVTVEGPIISNGKIQVVVSVGSDQTRVIQAETKVLTINLNTSTPSNGTTDITINRSVSELLSIAPQDTATENVLEATSPAIININAPATPTLEPTAIPTPTTQSTPTPTTTPNPTANPTTTPNPTATLTPTNTPTPTLANTVLNFNGLKLHGLGAGGDNPNPTSWGTLNPLRPTRDLVVEMYDTAGTLVYTGNTTITYTGSNTGLFNGSLTVPSSISTGTYTIKLTTPYYLTKLVPGFLNLIQGTTHSITSVALVAGDVNQDNQLRVSDYDIIMDCYTDLLPAKNCTDSTKQLSADISDDGVVNQDDYNLFLRELSVQAGD